MEFLRTLGTLSLNKKEPTKCQNKAKQPLEEYTYATVKSIYDDGIQELEKPVFYSAIDTELALRIVIRRAFPLMALNSSYRPKVNTTYIVCSKCSQEPNLESVKKYLGSASMSFCKGKHT